MTGTLEPARTPVALAAALLASAAVALAATGEPERRAAAVRYGRDVRPILSDRCFTCHGPDAAERQADLRLDLFETATAARESGAAIVPGVRDESLLWQRIGHADPDERMPPADSNRRALSEEERETIGRWIDAGAPYEPHWAFVPPVRPSVPEPRAAAELPNPVDRFLVARLEAEGIAPGPPAPPETQLRRLFLDLTGLPPTPEELAAFRADPAPDRYERAVARIFAEEPYRTRHAERMAAPWMDQARYADTSGIHMDAGRQMWLWRDWVLAAYRENMPFDRFLTEQLAGDLLPDATVEQRIASGFNRNHVTTDEGGAIDAEYLVEYAVDRTATTGSVFLGLTLGCARCHDHKFDPISQDDFYRFYAYFNSNEEPGLYSQVPDANRALEPFLVVPTDEQARAKHALETTLAEERAVLDVPAPGEDEERAAFLAELARASGLAWAASTVAGAESLEGATLAVGGDGTVRATGENPDRDEHVIRLRTEATDLALIALEALGDADAFEGRVGRAPNGNAVLSGIAVEAVSLADPTQRREVRLAWAWADVEQPDGEFGVLNALDPDALGWAVDAHRVEGPRAALFLADEPFGFEGGTEVVVRLAYRSDYARHTFARVRLSLGALGALGAAGRDALPVAASDWLVAGPFPTGPAPEGYAASFGPELDLALDRERDFEGQRWRFVRRFPDGRLNGELEAVTGVTYLGRRLHVPSARTVKVGLGSDDGFRLFLDGVEVASRQVDRALAADQDEVELVLGRGEHVVVLAIVNTGGLAGFAWSPRRSPGRDGEHTTELAGPLLAAFLPPVARTEAREAALAAAWRLAFSPEHRARVARIEAAEAELAALEAATPRTMVMKELAEPRETFVLMRGAYDRPDPERRVTRGVPAALGTLPDDAPASRLGLAQWLVSAENPLVARVAVNRLWELVFGAGLVRTSEDFGLQGEWPTHPELLDWLAVELRESGWDQQHVLKLLVTSAAYRQESRVRPEVLERDPENRLLAWLPRTRLSAEAIRDQALFVAGLLVERAGGPSVKPYQPEGLWQEVAMIQSNTRAFERGDGDDLWRRSLYTYWKRACPPPSLMTFDAPTRESCTIRRATTNTPLQALVLWNDEQFVEAARALAARTLADELAPSADDRARLARLFERCAARAPQPDELDALAAALARFRARYAPDPEAARALLAVGEAPLPEGLDPAELAAWTLLASAVLNLDEVITRG